MFLKIAGAILAGYMFVFTLFAIVVAQSGIAVVHVVNHKKGDSLFVPVPMALGSVGLALMPDHALASVRKELGPHRKIVNAAIRELRNCPDGPFVEVEGRDKLVVIEKRGDNIVVNVESEEEDVYIRVPLDGTQKSSRNCNSSATEAQSSQRFHGELKGIHKSTFCGAGLRARQLSAGVPAGIRVRRRPRRPESSPKSNIL